MDSCLHDLGGRLQAWKLPTDGQLPVTSGGSQLSCRLAFRLHCVPQPSGLGIGHAYVVDPSFLASEGIPPHSAMAAGWPPPSRSSVSRHSHSLPLTNWVDDDPLVEECHVPGSNTRTPPRWYIETAGIPAAGLRCTGVIGHCILREISICSFSQFPTQCFSRRSRTAA